MARYPQRYSTKHERVLAWRPPSLHATTPCWLRKMTLMGSGCAGMPLEGSESGTMTFPQSLRLLMEAGFDGYAVDFRPGCPMEPHLV